jgi:hypothetical protein
MTKSKNFSSFVLIDLDFFQLDKIVISRDGFKTTAIHTLIINKLVKKRAYG